MGGWDDPNCTRYPNPQFIYKGGLVDPLVRASNEHCSTLIDPSKLACYLFRDGG